MRNSLLALPLLAGACALGTSSTVHANPIIYEPFDYTSGQAITGQVNSYSAASETWQLAGPAAALHTVASGNLSAPSPLPAAIGNMGDLAKSGTSSAYDRLNIPNAFNPDLSPKYGAGSSLYYSLLLNVPSITGLTIAHTNLNANNDGLIAFNNLQGGQTSAPSTWNGELVIRLGSVAGTYNLGVRASTTPNNTTGSIAGATYWTGDLNPGDTHFIVVQGQLGASPGIGANSLNSIWLDPNPATFGAASAPTADGSSIGADSATDANCSMQSLIIGAGIATTGAAPNDTYMDEIRVGDTWADVTPVPEPTMIGLAGIGAMGFLSRRRRTT